MLSPHRDRATTAALLTRLRGATLLTDARKLDETLVDVPLAELTARVVTVTDARPGAVTLADLAGSPAST